MPESLFPLYRQAPGGGPSTAQLAAWQVGMDQSLGLTVRPVGEDLLAALMRLKAEQDGDWMGWLKANQTYVIVGVSALALLLLLGGRRR